MPAQPRAESSATPAGPSSVWGFATLGSFLIAITYGLARFAFGLLLPAIREDLGIGPGLAGLIGALPFFFFVVGIFSGPRLLDLAGSRWAAVITIGLGVAGLALIALSPGGLVLAVGVSVCGICTGLSTPILASAVEKTIPERLRGRVNATLNAGTSFGIMASVPAYAIFADSWRLVYVSFAGIAVLGCLLAGWRLPPGSFSLSHWRSARSHDHSLPSGQQFDLFRMSLLAAVMGMVSSLFWIFGPDYATQVGELPRAATAWMWMAVGLGGLLGIGAGDWLDRYGADRSHDATLALLSASLLLLAIQPGNFPLVLGVSALFGAAYMCMTGYYLVRSVRVARANPSVGPVLPFVSIAVGQVVGSIAGGWAIGAFSYNAAFSVFALVGLAVAATSGRALRSRG
jgi:predicted MFS family arabinose efflux permease